MYQFQSSTFYRKFIHDRDRALEKLHLNAQKEMSDYMRATFTHVMELAKHNYFTLIQDNNPNHIELINREIEKLFDFLGLKLSQTYKKLIKNTYTLTATSEIEAISQVQKKSHANRLGRSDLHKRLEQDSVAGGSVDSRIHLYLDRLRRKIVSNMQAAGLTRRVNEDGEDRPLDQEEFLQRVYLSLPKQKSVVVSRKVLKSIKEADQTKKPDTSQDFIDDEAWNDMLDSAKADYGAQFRGPESIAAVSTEDPNDVIYTWELERDVTQQFVQEVRDGQIDAANKVGITDFVWIAIIDDVTDNCCRWRDGLLTSEIEAELNGKHADDECRGITPPIHFNCRCSLAPATDAMPDRPDDGLKDFNEWLET